MKSSKITFAYICDSVRKTNMNAHTHRTIIKVND